MKRVFIVQNTPLGEPLPLSVFLTGLLGHYKREPGWEINLAVGKSGDIPPAVGDLCEKIFQPGSDTYSIKDNLRFGLRVRRLLKRAHREREIHIVHCFYPNSSLLGAVLFKMFRWRGKKPAIIYDVRSPWIEMSVERGFVHPKLSAFYRRFLYLGERFLCRWVDHFVFITPGLADYYQKRVKIKPARGINVIPSGVDPALFRPVESDIRQKYAVAPDEILICSVGGIARIRGLDDFLHIFKEVAAGHGGVKLMFVGEGDLLEDLEKLVGELSLSRRVIFVGSVPHRRIPEFICAGDFGLVHLPDLFVYRNSFPLKILEYLGCGVPVLASDIESNVEISKKLKGIYIYENGRDILDILKRAERKPVTQDISEYSWENLAAGYRSIYEGLH